MKQFLIKFLWAFFWLFFGLMIAHTNNITDTTQVVTIMMASLLIADGFKLVIRKIASHALV